MKVTNVKLQDLMVVIDKCEGDVFLHTEDGDKLNLKSKLSQLVGIFNVIAGGEVRIANITATNLSDESRIFRFLLYGEV